MNSATKIKEQVEQAISEGKQIVANPKTLNKLREVGMDIPDGSGVTPWEEYVKDLFNDEHKDQALERVRKLPPLPDLNVEALIIQYSEILKCVAYGLNGAAITLCCVLVEFMLKFAIFKVEMGGFGKYDESKWDELENLEFGDAIGRAANNRLLSSSQKKKLNEFRVQIRNPYLHYNIKKITKDMILRNVERLNLATGEVKTLNIPAKGDPTVQPSAKLFNDERQVFDVFAFTNSIVTELWDKIQPLQGKKDDPETSVAQVGYGEQI